MTTLSAALFAILMQIQLHWIAENTDYDVSEIAKIVTIKIVSGNDLCAATYGGKENALEHECASNQYAGSFADDTDVIMLNEGLLSSPDQLEDTLLHELVHAAQFHNRKYVDFASLNEREKSCVELEAYTLAGKYSKERGLNVMDRSLGNMMRAAACEGEY